MEKQGAAGVTGTNIARAQRLGEGREKDGQLRGTSIRECKYSSDLEGNLSGLRGGEGRRRVQRLGLAPSRGKNESREGGKGTGSDSLLYSPCSFRLEDLLLSSRYPLSNPCECLVSLSKRRNSQKKREGLIVRGSRELGGGEKRVINGILEKNNSVP